MLLNLHVKNFAIIDEVEVYFKDNLNILTGETGAGKSIIIGSINVALGGKVTKDIIRKGADYALVELLFQVEDKDVLTAIGELDVPLEDDQIIISRKIMNGKSICKVNGETVTTNVLKSIASLLIDIHGQHEHQSLLYKEKHLEIVDRYAKDYISDTKQKLEAVYKDYIEVKNKLNELKIDDDKRLREISFLEYEINEIRNAALKSGEDEVLGAEYRRLSNAKAISEGLGNIHGLMSNQESGSAGDQIGRSVKSLTKLVDYDSSITNFLNQIVDIESLVNDFNRELSEYLSDLNNSEEDFNSIEQRLDLINHLKSKYGNSIAEILKYCEESEKKLEEYNNYEDTILLLTQQQKKSEEQLNQLCEELSVIRQEKAKELTHKMKEALVDLNFLDVKFELVFRRLDYYTDNGFDESEFEISTNPGEELKPLAKIASGGELSRIMLAIKSVLADKDEIDTLIFDEIDVGISGRTAQKVSEKLSMISKNHQVICITHLAQIAAMADAHFIIEKTTDGITTKTSIRNLNETESIEELARILGGAVITDTVIDNAREMKELAKGTKKF
ncbi:DNA repair protein RecN [Anaerocolumna aminovalerica]|uniref:DNA repair protein RecN n=1 Tax=Anaerocolumna aminovalerica TaxID=1527 RepID=A0A1I5EY70_9FIRM|nr:DNA repair protein RecN [Anaerocolumna aminovalerica]MBU5332052.1 DNA repair protein RecN [Anaerocolumna aminovalerica]SFO16383.1 DNA replication and repair protein RecN [Anaerocolumna aminovalerica]